MVHARIEGKDMKANDAYKIIKEKHENEKLLECLEFDSFFAFLFAENESDIVGGGYDTVDKNTGDVSTFNPTSDLDSFFKAEQVPIENVV